MCIRDRRCAVPSLKLSVEISLAGETGFIHDILELHVSVLHQSGSVFQPLFIQVVIEVIARLLVEDASQIRRVHIQSRSKGF